MKTIDTINIPPFKRLVITIGELPTTFVESMSYYEALAWLVDYIEKNVVKVVNNNAEATKELQDDFVLLKDYVEHYFDNLDVQNEINNKLDAMALDGTLESLLNDVATFPDITYFHTIAATPFYRGNNALTGMQGGCILPDGKIFQCTGANPVNNGKLLVFGQDGTLINSADCDFGHCNSACYNSKTGTIFICGGNSDTHADYIYEVNPTTLALVEAHDISGKSFPADVYGIAYDEDKNVYIFINAWDTSGNAYKLWVTDDEFTVTDTETYYFKLDGVNDLGWFGKYLGVVSTADNHVLLFDGNDYSFVKDVKIDDLISDTWFITEIEWIDSVDDVVYLGALPHSATIPNAWGGGAKVYAKCDLKNNYRESVNNHTAFMPYKEVYFVDGTGDYDPLRNGTAAHPFANVYEAINSSLRSGNVTGVVEINLTNAIDTFEPLFTMGKKYFIYCDTSTITLFSNIFVDRNAEVIIYPNVVLQGDSEGIDPLNVGAANVQVRGRLVANYMTISTGDPLSIATSADGYVDMKIADEGLDLTHCSGVVNNHRRGTVYDLDNFTFPSTGLDSFALQNALFALESGTGDASYNYGVPYLGRKMNIIARANVVGKGSVAVNNELAIPVITNAYMNQTVTFIDGDDALQTLQFRFDGTDKFTIDLSDGTILNERVRVVNAA